MAMSLSQFHGYSWSLPSASCQLMSHLRTAVAAAKECLKIIITIIITTILTIIINITIIFIIITIIIIIIIILCTIRGVRTRCVPTPNFSFFASFSLS